MKRVEGPDDGSPLESYLDDYLADSPVPPPSDGDAPDVPWTVDDDVRDSLIVRPGYLSAAADAVEAALPGVDGLYARGGLLVTIRPPEADDPAAIHAVTTDHLARLVDSSVRCEKYTKKGLAPCDPPVRLISAVWSSGRWPGVRPLTAIQTTPPIRPDGSVSWDDGYDPETCAYYAPVGQVVRRQRMIQADAEKALGKLRDLVADFPWADDLSRDAMIAGILSPLIRPWSGPAPITIITATTPAAGKTLIADVIGTIVLGRSLPRATWTEDAEEARKTLMSLAMAGTSMVLWDNVRAGTALSGPVVDASVTAERVLDRVLGSSRVADVPIRCCWYATGNNITASGDTSRRAIVARLAPTVERPEERTDYRIADLRQHVRDARPYLLGEALVIVAGYLAAGCPDAPAPIGSFEGWSRYIRGAILWSGGIDVADALASRTADADPEADLHRWLLAVWDDVAKAGMTASAAIYRATGDGACQPLQELLVAICPGRTQAIGSPQQLSARLTKLLGRVREIDGRALRLVREKAGAGAYTWRVEEVA